MKNFIRLSRSLLLLCLCLTFLCIGIALFAFDVSSDFDLSTGYRNDCLQLKNTLELTPPAVDQTDQIKINDISIWHIGINGRFLISPLLQNNFNECSCLHNFFLAGFAYWGCNICDAHMHETIRGNSQKQVGKAKIINVNTYDYQIGLGYLVDWNNWNLSLSSGYAYDKQKIGAKHGEISYPSGSPFEPAPLYGTGYKTATTWKGPWIGIELSYFWCRWKASAGYEYHFARYNANHHIPVGAIAQIEGYKTNTKSDANGNVIFLKGIYLLNISIGTHAMAI